MADTIKREDAIKHFQAKADHYRKRLARIEAQGDAIGYDPTEQINGFKDEIAVYEDVVKEIKAIPSADKQGEWIPCSERLPKESGDYLVTYEWVEAIGTRYTEVEIVPFAHNRWEFFIDPEEVLAWMPLPEPWKGADNEAD